VLHRRTNNYFDLLPLDAAREEALKLRVDEQHRTIVEPNSIRGACGGAAAGGEACPATAKAPAAAAPVAPSPSAVPPYAGLKLDSSIQDMAHWKTRVAAIVRCATMRAMSSMR